MKVTVQVVIEGENGTSTMVQEVGQLEREGLQPENLGLKLVEAKHLLQAVQRVLVEEQIRAALAQLASCPQCGAVHRHKDACKSCQPLAGVVVAGATRIGSRCRSLADQAPE